jgi:hypothetical protein
MHLHLQQGIYTPMVKYIFTHNRAELDAKQFNPFIPNPSNTLPHAQTDIPKVTPIKATTFRYP